MALTATEFQQQNNKQGRCFNYYANSVVLFEEDWQSGKRIGDANNGASEISTPKLTWNNSSSSQQAQGCLEYEWSLGTGKKWEGSRFRFVWVLSQGNNGFSVFLVGTGKNDKSFEFDGVAHTFVKESNGWKVDKKLEIKNKTLNSGDVKDKFPKNSTSDPFKTWSSQDGYWNFLKSDASDVAGSIEKDSQWFYFKSSEGSEVVSNWSSNLSTWWENFFDKSKWDMVELVKEIKGGWKH